MGTTVQEAGQKVYTDSSGKFYEGMKKEDISGKKILLFFDAEKEFDRIDSDMDGVLSHDEITAEINKDIKNNDTMLVANGGAGIALSLAGLGLYKLSGKVSKVALAVIIWDGIMALRNVFKSNQLEQRIAQGHN